MGYLEEYKKWCESPEFDEETKNELLKIKGDEKEIEDRFYKELEFGTAGLRGIIGAGTNRMNKYTVGKATQGLANYILEQKTEEKGVAISYDSRKMSKEFSMQTALILAANGIKSYLFENLRPVPELSFAVRKLGCTAGIMITASHNPPKYNGYKVYWEDGAQIVAPRDKEIIAKVRAVENFSEIKEMPQKEAEEKANSTKVWVLSENVISGQIITTDMLTQQVTNKNLVPSNAIGDMSILSNYALTDKEGNEITTEYKNNNATLRIVKDGTKYEIKTEEETGSYYIEKNGNKEYIELSESPVIAKINMDKNSVITLDMVSKSDEKTTNDLRKVEYNMLVLPTQIQTGEYVDIRLSLPSGQDYIVVSKKQVEIPQINGVDSEDTIWLKLTEDEIITMNSAIVDAYKSVGSTLKVVTYTEAGVQDAATPTYVPTGDVMQLINSDPNIIQKAKNALVQRYMANQESVRTPINSAINGSGEDGQENLKTKVEESITNSKENRTKYLDSLGGDY
mgnify:CR=1 FL=1